MVSSDPWGHLVKHGWGTSVEVLGDLSSVPEPPPPHPEEEATKDGDSAPPTPGPGSAVGPVVVGGGEKRLRGPG